MINKYQTGGTAPQLGGVLALIQQLPREQLQLLMLAFAQWAQQKGVDIQQLQLNPEALEQALGQFMQEMLAQQALMAKHGAKLQFIKGLKHQCPEGEHLEYYAKGGAIGCGCVKNQKGGKTEPKKSALEQYKESKRTKAEQAKIDSLSQADYERGFADHTKPGTEKKKLLLKKDKCGGKMKKHQIGGTLETLRQSLGLEKKNLTKFQTGGNLTPLLTIQIKQANTLTQQNPTIGGFQVNNGQFDVISAEDGDKLPSGRYLDRNRWKKLPPRGHYTNLPPLEPDVKADNNTYNGGQLPGVTVIAPDLSKPQRFPYGGINVISKSTRGNLDRKLNILVNPFEGHDLVASKQQAGGPIERADNTRVTSGRPQTVLNRIPYGAGKGPAADSPMRLFNDPYVGIGMMAMAPIASRGFSSTKPASVNKFSTYIKGLPKSMSTSNKVAIGAGTVGGIALGYDDNHNQYVREGLRKMGIEFPLGLNPKGDSIYNDRHIFDNLLKYMLEYKL